MAPWLYRYQAADTIHARDEHVIGPEAPLGSEHNCAQWVENARTCKVVAVSVRALSVVGKTLSVPRMQPRKGQAAGVRGSRKSNAT